ncbi:hypothetical protein KIN20_015504 [Parelaphostrongylus tenuis]|uniref:Uncharacterized protein n=1 Tax=Parelaphostrongylus tenuis TaxID=148309 RepID=A0AAD5MIL0_PARTN|nr:hypothetical protein KIN20_015504 [Parelaphostrongylus tenuis]
MAEGWKYRRDDKCQELTHAITNDLCIRQRKQTQFNQGSHKIRMLHDIIQLSG